MKVLYTNKGLMTESEYLDVKKHDKNIVSYGPAAGGPEPSFNFAKHIIIKEELQHSQAGFVDTVPAVVSEDEIEEKACLDEIDLSDLMDTQAVDRKSSHASKEKGEKRCSECGSPLDPGGYCMSGCDDEDGKATYYYESGSDQTTQMEVAKGKKKTPSSTSTDVIRAIGAKAKDALKNTKGLQAAKQKMGQSYAGQEMLKQFKIDDDDRDRLERPRTRPGTDREIQVVDHVKTLETALDKLNRGTVKSYDSESAERQFGALGAVAIIAKDDGHAKDIAKQIESMTDMTDLKLKVLRKSFKNIDKPTYVLAILNDKSEEILEMSGDEKSEKKHVHKWVGSDWNPKYTTFDCADPECRAEKQVRNVYDPDTDDEMDAIRDYRRGMYEGKLRETIARIVKQELVKEAYDRHEDGYLASLTWGQFPSYEILEKALEDGFTMELQGRESEVFDKAMVKSGIKPGNAIQRMQTVEGLKQVVEALMVFDGRGDDEDDPELSMYVDEDEANEQADIAQMLASGIMDVIGVEWI